MCLSIKKSSKSHLICLEVFSFDNTPGTRGGPGSRDQTLAVMRRKTPENQLFVIKFSASGDSPKWVKAKDGGKKIKIT